MWTRSVAGSALHEIRARVAIAAPAEQVWQVLNDTAHFTEFMPYVVEAAIRALWMRRGTKGRLFAATHADS